MAGTNDTNNPDPATLEAIDAAAERWKGGDQAAEHELWERVMKLPEWVLLVQGRVADDTVKPFISAQKNGAGVIQAFTSLDRAREGGQKLGVLKEDQKPDDTDAYSTLAMPPAAAIHSLAPMMLAGVAGIAFDAHRYGAFAGMSNLPVLLENATGTVVDEIIMPAAPGEIARRVKAIDDADDDSKQHAQARLTKRLLYLPLLSVAQQSPENPQPLVLDFKGSGRFIVMATGQDAIQGVKTWFLDKGAAEPSFQAGPMRDCVKYWKLLLDADPAVEGLLIDPGSADYAASLRSLTAIWDNNPDLDARHERAEAMMKSAQKP